MQEQILACLFAWCGAEPQIVGHIEKLAEEGAGGQSRTLGSRRELRTCESRNVGGQDIKFSDYEFSPFHKA